VEGVRLRPPPVSTCINRSATIEPTIIVKSGG
jgi:hypothetical protein